MRGMLDNLKTKLFGMAFIDSFEADRFAMHNDGYNQALEEVFEEIDQLLEQYNK